jgi:signal peptidase I
MHPTVSPGDLCLCRINMKFEYDELERGMIVLLKHEDYDHFLTKRIIAKEKETIEIRRNKTYIDKQILREQYVNFSVVESLDNRMLDMDPVYVEANKLFVMGDNRNFSMDSRYSRFGLVDFGDVVGKPLIFLWSKDKSKIGRKI